MSNYEHRRAPSARGGNRTDETGFSIRIEKGIRFIKKEDLR